MCFGSLRHAGILNQFRIDTKYTKLIWSSSRDDFAVPTGTLMPTQLSGIIYLKAFSEIERRQDI